jgi:thymidine kinase
MFLERDVSHRKPGGIIEVITGSMFSGKTEELIRRLKRARFARQKAEIYKPVIDTRFAPNEVISHDDHSIPSTSVENSATILLLSSDAEVVGIDEAQFFDKGLVEVCSKLAGQGLRVIVAGLDMDFKGQPFGPMPRLMAVADYVTKLHAICIRCGQVAQFSHRLVSAEKQILLGEKSEYEPLCRDCYQKVSGCDS